MTIIVNLYIDTSCPFCCETYMCHEPMYEFVKVNNTSMFAPMAIARNF